VGEQVLAALEALEAEARAKDSQSDSSAAAALLGATVGGPTIAPTSDLAPTHLNFHAQDMRDMLSMKDLDETPVILHHQRSSTHTVSTPREFAILSDFAS